MVTIQKTTPGSVRYRALGTSLGKGDTADVSESHAAWLCDERGECERVDGEEDSDEVDESEADGEDADADDDLTDIDEVNEEMADDMRELGFEVPSDVRAADIDDLTEIPGVGEKTAKALSDAHDGEE